MFLGQTFLVAKPQNFRNTNGKLVKQISRCAASMDMDMHLNTLHRKAFCNGCKWNHFRFCEISMPESFAIKPHEKFKTFLNLHPKFFVCEMGLLQRIMLVALGNRKVLLAMEQITLMTFYSFFLFPNVLARCMSCWPICLWKNFKIVIMDFWGEIYFFYEQKNIIYLSNLWNSKYHF